MRRRLDLAISMIVKPRLLFLDEPTTGLDPRSREQVWGAVRSLVAEGVTVLLTTQYLEEADRLADRVAVLHDGRIVAEDTPSALKSAFGGDRLRLEFPADAAAVSAHHLLGGDLDAGLNTVEVPTDASAQSLSATLSQLAEAGIEPMRVSTHHPSLDDVFLALTERSAA